MVLPAAVLTNLLELDGDDSLVYFYLLLRLIQAYSLANSASTAFPSFFFLSSSPQPQS